MYQKTRRLWGRIFTPSTACLCPCPPFPRRKRHRASAMRELPGGTEAGAAASVADLADDQLRGNDACGCALGVEIFRRLHRIEADAFAGAQSRRPNGEATILSLLKRNRPLAIAFQRSSVGRRLGSGGRLFWRSDRIVASPLVGHSQTTHRPRQLLQYVGETRASHCVGEGADATMAATHPTITSAAVPR